MKRRILALALVMALLAGCFSFAAAEEEEVAVRLVLAAVSVNGRMLKLDPEKDAVDVFTFYTDGTATVVLRNFSNISYSGPEITLEGLWDYCESPGLYEFTYLDDYTGQLVTWPIRESDDYDGYYEADYWGKRLFLEDFAEEDASYEPVGPALPAEAAWFDTPFEGDAQLHRAALFVWTSALNKKAQLHLAEVGAAENGSWERYAWRDGADFAQDIYLLCDRYGEAVYAYACALGENLQNSAVLNAFLESAVSVDAGFDGTEASLNSDSFRKARQALLDSFDADQASDALNYLLDMAGDPDAGVDTVSICGHNMTVIRVDEDGETGYWFFYHNTAADEAGLPEEGWTCPNGHTGNTGNFCTECGAPKPAVSFCPNCGQDVRGLNANFCPNCGKPLN